MALSGDGGDELFAGYNRYRLATALWTLLSRMPAAAAPAPRRAALSDHAGEPGTECWRRRSRLLPERLRPQLVGDKLHKLADVLGRGRRDDVYRGARLALAAARRRRHRRAPSRPTPLTGRRGSAIRRSSASA